MEQTVDLEQLSAFFDSDDIEWKPIAMTKDRKKGLAAAYVTNRAIMDRLDEACGPANWKNEYTTGPGGGVLCGLSIRFGDEWITKWDGAENTDIEAVKGGLSNSMRRAAVHWGIGRYLYRLPAQWVAMDERGRFAKPPQIPPAYRPRPRNAQPSGSTASGSRAPASASPGTPSGPPTPPAGQGRPTGPSRAESSRSGSSRSGSSRSGERPQSGANSRATTATNGPARSANGYLNGKARRGKEAANGASGQRGSSNGSDADQYFIR